MTKWRVGHKLAAGFTAVIFFLISLLGVQAYGDTLVRQAVERLYEGGIVGAEALGRASATLQRLRGRAFQHAAATDPREHQQIEQEIETLGSDYLEALQQYERTITDGARRTALDEARVTYRRYAELQEQQLVRSRELEPQEALTLISTTIRPQFDAAAEALDRLLELHMARGDEVNRDAFETLDITGKLSLLLTILATAVALIAAWVLSRSISGRLRDVAAVARAAGTGSLDARVVVSGSDEIAEVGRSLNTLTQNLSEQLSAEQQAAQRQQQERERLADTVTRYGSFVERLARGELTARLDGVEHGELRDLGQNLRAMGEALRTMTLRIHEAVGALSSATAEIMTTVQEHATSANESASAVAETAATVDEVQQSAQRATEQAKHVADVSRKSAQVSDAGRQAVDHTVVTMDDVRQQMDGIAERILSLSEQTQAVGQIITSVNELAERSNLLALNAAIEAARAGEAGRGFAVVAQEIRALADQSKEATAHVRAILGDVQSSTTEAVLATEEGSKAVARALDAVKSAGERFEQLAGSIGEASRAADHILTATQQQAEGVGQISHAMHSIDQASRQTVDGTRNIESAARDLNQLSADLRDTVAQYRT